MAGFRWRIGDCGDRDGAVRDEVGDVEEDKNNVGVKGFWMVQVVVVLLGSEELFGLE